MKNGLVAVIIFLLGSALVFVALQMPPMGEKGNPTYVNTIPRYLEYGVEEAGAENIITGIILNYRGYDTMGEVTVIFSALASVLAVLATGAKKVSPGMDNNDGRASVLVRTVISFILPFIILYSVYTILHGDISPGGGFQGGAIIGGGLIIYLIVFGKMGEPLDLPVKELLLLEGTAVITFFINGILGLLTGTNFLTYILPGVNPGLQPVVRTLMLLSIEAGIGTAGASIFVAIFAALRDRS